MNITICIDVQSLAAIFSFIVVVMIIKWGIDEGIRERKNRKDKD